MTYTRSASANVVSSEDLPDLEILYVHPNKIFTIKYRDVEIFDYYWTSFGFPVGHNGWVEIEDLDEMNPADLLEIVGDRLRSQCVIRYGDTTSLESTVYTILDCMWRYIRDPTSVRLGILEEYFAYYKKNMRGT